MASKLRGLSAVLTSLFVLLLPLVFFLRVATSQPAPPQPLDPGVSRRRPGGFHRWTCWARNLVQGHAGSGAFTPRPAATRRA